MIEKIIPIDINYSEIIKRSEEASAVRNFEKIGTIPVEHCIVEQFYGDKIKHSLINFYNDPEDMLNTLILGQKWELENIKSNKYTILLRSHLLNVDEAVSLGGEPFLPNDRFNIANVRPWIKGKSDLNILKKIDPAKSDYRKNNLKFREKMLKLAKNIHIIFKDGVKIRLLEFSKNITLGGGTMGPFSIAQQLRGSDIYYDLMDNPKFVLELLKIVTDKIICWQQYLIDDNKKNGLGYAVFVSDDSAVNLSLEQFDKFSGEFCTEIMNYFKDYYLLWHMCGNADHLLEYFADNFNFNEYSLFGYMQNKEKIKKLFGNKRVLAGNVNPRTIQLGSKDDVFNECVDILNSFKDLKGYILSDGANVPPVSKKENINAMYEAVQFVLSKANSNSMC
jgi:uroporphyrinogen-III decarboxylase